VLAAPLQDRSGFINNARRETNVRPLRPVGGLHPVWIGGSIKTLFPFTHPARSILEYRASCRELGHDMVTVADLSSLTNHTITAGERTAKRPAFRRTSQSAWIACHLYLEGSTRSKMPVTNTRDHDPARCDDTPGPCRSGVAAAAMTTQYRGLDAD
jgi:hypothetical protein